LSTGIAYTIYFAARTAVSVRLFPARYRVMKFIPAFLILIAFIYLNTFYIVPWWCNLAPILLTAALHGNIILEMFRQGLKEANG
jgi:hypothetical protein